MKQGILAAVLALCVGCGGDSPTAATRDVYIPPAALAPAPILPVTLSGRVVATNGGQALAGLALNLGGLTTTTDAGGAFTYSRQPGASARLLLTGVGIVPRSLVVGATVTRDLQVDAIGVAGFDLTYYRALVRNGYEAPARLEPLRRWTRTPMIYLKTVDEAGVAIDATTLATVERTARESVPQWTSGRLGVPTVERGTDTREGQSGWITIRFPAQFTEEGFCGWADIAKDGGVIELYYTRVSTAATRCRQGGTVVAPLIVRHEVGHALGFFHTSAPTDVMYGGSWSNAQLAMSARELAAAAIAYQRPVGNTDPDVDPSGAVTLAPLSVR